MQKNRSFQKMYCMQISSPLYWKIQMKEKMPCHCREDIVWLQTMKKLCRRMENDDYFVRAYSKNKLYTGKHIATKLWVGDYSTGSTFEEFAREAEGISRIGVLRADVDNLGQAIVSGFCNSKNGDRYMTLSRTATLSRQLSLFFKYYIRFILENGEYSLEGKMVERKDRLQLYIPEEMMYLL